MMTTRKIGVALGIFVMLACVMIVLFRSVLFAAHTDDSGGLVAPRAGQTAAPVRSLPVVSRLPPAPAEPSAEPAEAPPPEPAAASGAAPSPDQELARLRAIFDGSGAAAGDALDRSSRDIAAELVTQLRSSHAEATLQAMECRGAGCIATIEVGREADYFRLHAVFDGMDPRSPLLRWSGSRVSPPVQRRDGKLLVAFMLIRPDAAISF